MTAPLDPCPGCGALFPASDGAAHPYIGASPGCWALFAPLGVGESPDPALLAASRVPEGAAPAGPAARPAMAARDLASLRGLVTDAYAVQHHGDASPQAVQSVAVHLLTLHGVLHAGHPVSSAHWLRLRPLRERGVFRKLEPPPLGSMLTLRHCWPGGGVERPATFVDYVLSVYAAWSAKHAGTIEEWFARYVIAEPAGAAGARRR